jgi:transposase
MLKRSDWLIIQEKAAKGMYLKDIAAELGVYPKSVGRDQKSAVIEHRIGKTVRFDGRFLDLARHYGFGPRACRP